MLRVVMQDRQVVLVDARSISTDIVSASRVEEGIQAS